MDVTDEELELLAVLDVEQTNPVDDPACRRISAYDPAELGEPSAEWPQPTERG